MPTTKKPKKALIQFAIAAVVSLILGVSAIGVTLLLVSTVASNAEQEKQQAYQEAQKAKTELAKLKQTQTVTGGANQQLQAVVEIPPGTLITPSMVAAIDLKDSPPTVGSFSQEADVIGKMASIAIKPGEVITKDKLLDDGGGIPVPEGMRAMTIQIDPIGGLNGALTSGAVVDVLTTLANGEEKITKTLLQGVQVVAVGSAVQAAGGRGVITSVTLSITPSQAELLALANNQGKFHLALRNPHDRDKPSVSGINVKQLVSGAGGSSARPIFARPLPSLPLPPPRAPEIPIQYTGPSNVNSSEDLPFPSGPETSGAKSFTMTIYKGGSSEEKTFESNE